MLISALMQSSPSYGDVLPGGGVTLNGENHVSKVKPEHPLSSQWYVIHGETVHGPFTGHDLRKKIERGTMGRNVLVQSSATPNWTKAINDSVLGVLFPTKVQSQTIANHQGPHLAPRVELPNSGGISSEELFQLSLTVCFFIGFVPVFGACLWSFLKGETGIVALFFQFWLSSLLGGIAAYVGSPFVMPFVLWMRLMGR